MEDKIKECFVGSMANLMLTLILLVAGNLGVRELVMCLVGRIKICVSIFLESLRFSLLKWELFQEKNYQYLYTKCQVRQL